MFNLIKILNNMLRVISIFIPTHFEYLASLLCWLLKLKSPLYSKFDNYFFDPLGRPTITAGSDGYIYTCRTDVRTSVPISKSCKTK